VLESRQPIPTSLLPRSRADRPPNLEDERSIQSKKWAPLPPFSAMASTFVFYPQHTHFLSSSGFISESEGKTLRGPVFSDPLVLIFKWQHDFFRIIATF
jgi:hypothetical protein